jgi:uncharacterized protein YndB with AHSA1/START domain
MMPRGVQHGTARVTLPSSREIRIERVFHAPPSLVFELWTTPSLVRRWWGDPSSPLVVCEIDLRVGGAWRYATGGAGDDALTWHGEYLEVNPPRILRTTEVFGDEPDAIAETTLNLDERDGGTDCTITVRHTSRANRDRHLASGVEQGLQRSLDRVDLLLAERAHPEPHMNQESNDE